MKNKNEVALGDKCFIIQGKNGHAEAVRSEVRLHKSKKHFYMVHGHPAITSVGYNKLNQVAGISILSPDRIGDKTNPSIEYDDDGVSRVTIRKIAVGFSPIGSLTIIDETVNFDLKSYLKLNVFKTWQKYRNMGDLTQKPKEAIENKMFVPILGSTGILLDMYHEESLSIMNDYINKQKFAERIAASIARRNCLKAHPAIATSTVNFQDQVATVTVYGFKSTFDVGDLNDIVANASKGIVTGTAELIEHQTDTTDEDLVVETDVADPEHDDSQKDPDIITDDKPEATLLEKIIRMRSVIGGEKFDSIVSEDIFDASEKKQNEVYNELNKGLMKKFPRA